MSTDRLNVAILEEFIKKVRLASKSGQKELKFTVSELENIIHNLHIINLRLLDKEQNSKMSQENEVISVVMDGGGFEENR